MSSTPRRPPAPTAVGGPGRAWFAGTLAQGVVEQSDDLAALDQGGWWIVVMTFEGQVRLWRFAEHHRSPLPPPQRPWPGVSGGWDSSMDEAAYVTGVREIRRRIREGDVYQVNLCRVVAADLDPDADPWALAAVLAAGNPAPYAGVLDLPGLRVVCASPELFLSRDGDRVASSPIKGTGVTEADLLPKDEAENIMIVDLVRNDLQHVCRPGTVEVTSLLTVESHPGLVHLVSTVEGRLRDDADWVQLFAATMPPGSVSGAPKSSALTAIADLEPVPRGPYCGAIGWVDADLGRAELAVGIRSFWWHHDRLSFGTGAGITWGSDPGREWAETQLKAARLIELASRPGPQVPAATGATATTTPSTARIT